MDLARGVELDLRLLPHHVQPLDGAQRRASACLRQGKVSGWQLEVLVAHCAFAVLLRRGSLSAFHNCYQLMSHSYALEVSIWREGSWRQTGTFVG